MCAISPRLSGVRVRGEPCIRGHQLVRVLLDPGAGDDRHVLQDLQGGDTPAEGAQPDVEQHRAQQRAPSSLVHQAPSSPADAAAGRSRYR